MGNLDISYKVFGIFNVNPFQFEFMTTLEPKRCDGSSNFCEFHNLSRKINGIDVNVLLMVYDNLETVESKSNSFDFDSNVEETQIFPYQNRKFFNDSKELLVIVYHESNFHASEIVRIDSELEKHYGNALIITERQNPLVPKRLGLSLIRR
jgi:hypothetical protein